MANEIKSSVVVRVSFRKYYIDVLVNKKGNEYISIAEVAQRNGERRAIYIHSDDIGKFIKALKTVRKSLSKVKV